MERTGEVKPRRRKALSVAKQMTKKNYMPKGYERVPFDTLPHSVPAGKVLVHNHVSHVATTPSGERGFHGWFEQPDASRHQELERCDCGWTRLPHYRLKWR